MTANQPKSSMTIAGDIDVTNTDYLISEEFERIGKLGELLVGSLPRLAVLNSCGVYAISIPEEYRVEYRSAKDASAAGNVISSWSRARLEGKWVEGAEIVYYGLAGSRSPRSLRRRLNDLLRHGRGDTTDRGPHKGGEILWQLLGYENFSLWASPTEDPPAPRQLEHQLLENFHRHTGQLPYANRQF